MMWGCRAAPCFFVRWGWQRYSRMTLGPSFHIMQPANTGWDVGVEDLCWSSLLIVSLGSRSDPFKYFLWRLQRHVENRKLVLKTPNNNSKKTWIHASSCCRDLPWEPQPSAVKGIYWNSPDPLYMVINYKMGNDEKTCKRTVAVFFLGNSLNPWMINVFSSCRTADPLYCSLEPGVCKDLQEWAEPSWPQGALARIHVSVTLHFILYTGKLRPNAAWLVCVPLWSTDLHVNCAR